MSKGKPRMFVIFSNTLYEVVESPNGLCEPCCFYKGICKRPADTLESLELGTICNDSTVIYKEVVSD